jgi:hypothetical protein
MMNTFSSTGQPSYIATNVKNGCVHVTIMLYYSKKTDFSVLFLTSKSVN